MTSPLLPLILHRGLDFHIRQFHPRVPPLCLHHLPFHHPLLRWPDKINKKLALILMPQTKGSQTANMASVCCHFKMPLLPGIN